MRRGASLDRPGSSLTRRLLRESLRPLGLLLLASASMAEAAHIRPLLDAETLQPAPGSRIALALSMIPERGWHGYWQNPGDAGAPAFVEWTLPAGAVMGPLRYPVPKRLMTQGLMNYVYDRPYALLLTLDVGRGLPRGTSLRIAGRARWLACSATLCVPEQAPVSINLVVGEGAISSSARARFDKWRRQLPVPLSRPATLEDSAGLIRISIPFSRTHKLSNPYFFPFTDRVIDYAAPQRITRHGDRLIVETKAITNGARLSSLDGLITFDGDHGFSVSALPGHRSPPGQ